MLAVYTHTETPKAEHSVRKNRNKNLDPSSNPNPAYRLRELIKNAELELARLFAHLRTTAGEQQALELADNSNIDDVFVNQIESKLKIFCRTASLQGIQAPTPTAQTLPDIPRATSARSKVRACH